MNILFHRILNLPEKHSRVFGKIRDADLLDYFSPAIAKVKEFAACPDDMIRVNLDDGLMARCIFVDRCIVEDPAQLVNQPVLLFGMDIEEFIRLTAILKEEEVSILRFSRAFFLDLNGYRQFFPFFDSEKIVQFFRIIPVPHRDGNLFAPDNGSLPHFAVILHTRIAPVLRAVHGDIVDRELVLRYNRSTGNLYLQMIYLAYLPLLTSRSISPDCLAFRSR